MIYFFKVGDECLVAPLSLFQPELFKITGTHNLHVQKRYVGDPEDPHDENYLRETSVSLIVIIAILIISEFI